MRTYTHKVICVTPGRRSNSACSLHTSEALAHKAANRLNGMSKTGKLKFAAVAIEPPTDAARDAEVNARLAESLLPRGSHDRNVELAFGSRYWI